jgi:predicted Fe-Mo cluster-binding NifX family protein
MKGEKTMKIALATDDDKGIDAVLSHHFGRCPYYILVDIDGEEIKDVKAAKNPFYGSHGEPGEVPNFIRGLGAEVIIAGGMGPRAIGFFSEFGIQAITGGSGVVKDVIKAYLNGELQGANACNDHDSSHHMDAPEHDEATRLKEEMVALRRDLAKAAERLARLEEGRKK